MSGRFLGVAGPFNVPGNVHGQISNLRMSLLTSFRSTSDGLMSVNVENCVSNIQHSQFTLNPEGSLSGIVKTFEIHINNLIREQIPNILCKGLQNIIEKNSPSLFQRLATVNLSQHFQSFNGTSVIERFIRRFTKELVIDGRNIADPIVTNNFFETQQWGELRYNDNYGSVPFYPRPMALDNDSNRMLYLYGSDYILNSLLYHAYETDRLNLKIEESTLPNLYKNFVKTSCLQSMEADLISGICVGKLIPSIEKSFPNSTTTFLLLPHNLPEVRFVDGISSMDLQTRILTYVIDDNGTEHQILVSSADGVADIKLFADDNRFSGDLKLRKLNVRLHRSIIDGIDPESISQLAPLAKTFLGPQLARGLKQGFPYPLRDSITFIKPQLSIRNGFLRLETDFELGEEKLKLMVKEAFDKIKENP